MIHKIKQKLNKDVSLNEIIKGTSLTFIYKLLGLFLGYVVVLIISRNYGTNGLGLYSLSLSVLIIMSIFLNMGMSSSIIRFIGEYRKDGNLAIVKTIYIQMIVMVIALTLPVSILLFFGADYIAKAFFKDTTLAIAFSIISVMLPFYVVNMINIDLIRGLKHIKLSEYIRNLHQPLWVTIFLILLILFTDNIYIPLVALALTIIISIMITFFNIRKIFYNVKAITHTLSYKEILKISLPMQISSLGVILMANVDNLMIGAFLTTGAVGLYALAFSIAMVSSFMLIAINAVIIPRFAEYYWSKKEEDLKKSIYYSLKIPFFFSLFYSVIVIIFAEDILHLFGDEFENAKYTLIILTVGQFLNSYFGPIGAYLNVTGRQVEVGIIVLFATLVNIILNYFFIQKFGIEGAAFATVLSILLWKIPLVIYVKNKENLNFYYIPRFYKGKK